MNEKGAIGITVIVIFALLISLTAVSADSDNLSIASELTGDTQPFNSDTDNDGLNDSEELYGNTDATDSDTDNDGLEDGEEVKKFESNPNSRMSDSDNISDGVEVREYGTNPSKTDTDSDGLADDREIFELETSPTNEDTDGDNLTDGEEIRMGYNPTNPDMDSDGLEDGLEVNKLNSSPTSKHSDNDGLNDSREYELGTYLYSEDTDNDGIEDDVELEMNDISENLNMSPTKMDIRVEIDFGSNTNVSNESIRNVVGKFNNAPIENPDGSRGINAIFYTDENIETDREVGLNKYYRDYQEEAFDTKGYGSYHVLVVDSVPDEQGEEFNNVTGVTNEKIDGTLVEDNRDEEVFSATLMHEIGHQVGLWPDAYEGIDSTNVTFTANYESVMNYRSPSDFLGFSSSEPFDDWEYIEENYAENQASTSRVD